MRASSRLRLLFALLLALSAAGKVIAGDQSLRGAERTIQSTAKDRIAALLGRRGFRVDEIEGQPDSPFVLATAGNCRLLAVLAAPGGWHRDITHRFASQDDQVFFVFDGMTYGDQPRWRPWAHHYWHVLNLQVGRELETRPVLGIVASSACDLRDMPWQDLTRLS